MKVLFVTNMFPVPDYIYFGIHVKEQINAIEALGPFEKEVYFINGRADKLNYLRSISGIRKLVKRGGFDLIHIHYGLAGLFLLFFKPAIPVVITLHSGELYQKKGYLNHLMQKNITLSLLKRVDKIIVLNDDMVQLLKPHAAKLLKQPCGTDLELFRERRVLTRPEKKIKIGFPGNKARPEKNFILFEQIVGKLRAEFDISVIEFHNLTREEVVRDLNEIDLLLMTSLVEGSPQIIKEALACNKPVVSTNVGDVSDVLNGVRNSYSIDSFEPDDFVGAVKEILLLPREDRLSDGRDKLRKMGLGADQVARVVKQVYHECI